MQNRVWTLLALILAAGLAMGCGGSKNSTKTGGTRSLLDAVQDSSASSEFSEGYKAMFAFDNKPETRWMAGRSRQPGWLEARFAEPRTFTNVSFLCTVQELEGVPKEFVVEYWDAVSGDWATAVEINDNDTDQWSAIFEGRTSDRWRLRVNKTINPRGDLTISEMTYSR